MECTTNYYTTNKIENLWICCKMYRRSKIRLLLSFCSLLFLSGWLIIFQSLNFIFRFSGSLIQLLHIKDTYQMTSLFNFSLPLRTDPVDWESKTVSGCCHWNCLGLLCVMNICPYVFCVTIILCHYIKFQTIHLNI